MRLATGTGEDLLCKGATPPRSPSPSVAFCRPGARLTSGLRVLIEVVSRSGGLQCGNQQAPANFEDLNCPFAFPCGDDWASASRKSRKA